MNQESIEDHELIDNCEFFMKIYLRVYVLSMCVHTGMFQPERTEH